MSHPWPAHVRDAGDIYCWEANEGPHTVAPCGSLRTGIAGNLKPAGVLY